MGGACPGVAAASRFRSGGRWQRIATRLVATGWACGLALGGMAAAQDSVPPAPPVAAQAAISGNPAASDFSTGTGWLGRTLGLRDEWGVTLGGLWLADTNVVVAGGAKPGGWTNNSALFLGLHVDADKLVGWRGAAFGFQFLQFNGADTLGEAGSVMGYNGIVGAPPWQRTEFFQYWYRQEIIKDTLQVRIGRSAPATDFNNVLRPVTFNDSAQNIPAVSGVLYSTVFAGSLLGVIPGYYNSAVGITVTATPTESVYFNAGFYDGNRARHVETGLAPPHFNGYYFMIGEMGVDWLLGEGNHPGQFAVGLWRQTGMLEARGVVTNGAGGFYLFGSQRVAFGVNPRVSSSSVSVFFQFGVNEGDTLLLKQYYGAGITGFGLVGNRERDSLGFGVAYSRLNPVLFARESELMFQAYYQAHVVGSIYLQPTVSLIPTPGAAPDLPCALTTTLRLTVLF